MRKKRQDEDLLPFYVIKAAIIDGDSDAIKDVLEHFKSYIATLETITLYDKKGNPCPVIDETLRAELEDKLMHSLGEFEFVAA